MGQSCCNIIAIYEAPDRDYWFRVLLSCKAHKYRLFWVQLASDDDESFKEEIKGIVSNTNPEDHIIESPRPPV